jgi:hypothetical protein
MNTNEIAWDHYEEWNDGKKEHLLFIGSNTKPYAKNFGVLLQSKGIVFASLDFLNRHNFRFITNVNKVPEFPEVKPVLIVRHLEKVRSEDTRWLDKIIAEGNTLVIGAGTVQTKILLSSLLTKFKIVE